MKWVLIICLLIGEFANAQMQNLYMPRNLQEAYKKGTRSIDGKPGKNYWQNYGRYDITITAMPPDRNIAGKEKIVYVNNSPDTIRNPNFKLLLNIHKPGATRLGDVPADYLNSGIKIDKFAINGKDTKWDEPQFNITNKPVRLSRPLAPHDSVEFYFEWHYEISLQSNREGMLDATTYFLAYFYPRVAVFDDYYGWDRMTFNDGIEFYNDFNDYTVTVNVPKNYIVWGTGTLLNADDVLQPSYANKFKQSLNSDDIVTIASSNDLVTKKITAQNNINAWKWASKNIPDVTFALSDHYVWDASSVIVDKKTQRRASVQAAYIDTAKDFHQMVEFGKHSLNWFSNNWPGKPYPYEKTTIVQGFADMEYPMMVNDNTTPDPEFSRFVAEHEIAHTWFPFYMGINETRWGFMDEGWATTLELLIGREDLGIKKAEENFKQFRVAGFTADKSAEADVPIITPANVLSGQSLGNNEYGKASLAYLAVKDLLGDEVFKKCLHAFIDRWNGKHPTPWDFFYTFNDVAGKNLNWFWDNWFFNPFHIDYAISKVNKTKTGYDIVIDNVGGLAAPLDVLMEYESPTSDYADDTREVAHKTPAIWGTKQKQVIINIVTKRKIKSVRLEGGIFMDANETDNYWAK